MTIDGIEFKQEAVTVHLVTDGFPQVAQIDTIYVTMQHKIYMYKIVNIHFTT